MMTSKWRFYLTLLCLLTSLVLATIYLAWLIFPLEIGWLDLPKQVSLSSSVILSNFNQLMTYLTQFWSPRLSMTDFPSSEAGLKHFADVKGLFLLTQGIFLLTLWPAIRFFGQDWRQTSFASYRLAIKGFALLPLGIAVVVMLVGFETFFYLFHQIFFAGKSNWLFNPFTDPVILILPETFFLHCFVIFFVLYELVFWGLYFWGRKR
ncbi:TIGR01906 family membrane protein [Streptococcus sp. sy010]|uniref:TIGR01906 family membrane protein n=1 Tax=Streptococcus sp. sy010 TaxID=2600148 RepID=UPI0028F43A7A|nr:TIGR01906 family membrane protein [Streptococcus sp. sy010]